MNEYAFPRKLPDVLCSPDEALRIIEQHAGMTLRDYFAAKAMQAAATNPAGADGFTYSQRAEWAYLQADAMLIARKA